MRTLKSCKIKAPRAGSPTTSVVFQSVCNLSRVFLVSCLENNGYKNTDCFLSAKR